MPDDTISDLSSAGTGKAQGFAQKVRLGEHLAKVEQSMVDLGVIKARALELVADVDRAQLGLAAIAEALAKERG